MQKPIYTIISEESDDENDILNPPFILSIFTQHIAPRGLVVYPDHRIAFRASKTVIANSAAINKDITPLLLKMDTITLISLTEQGDVIGQSIIPIEIAEA